MHELGIHFALGKFERNTTHKLAYSRPLREVSDNLYWGDRLLLNLVKKFTTRSIDKEKI